MKLQHIPNALCVFRIVLVAPLLWFLAAGQYLQALLLFVLAGLTDAADGFLARHFDWRTRLGAVLDPLADKVLMVSVFITLALLDLIPVWLGAVVVARDVVIVSGILAYRVLFGPFTGAAAPVSKINTLLQLVFVTVVLAHAALGLGGDMLITVLGALVFVSTTVSGIGYIRDGSLLALAARKGAPS